MFESEESRRCHLCVELTALTATLVLVSTGAACGGGDTPTEPTGPSTGNLTVSVSTTGPDPDPNGYLVTLDGERTSRVDANGDTEFSNLAVGSHVVEMSDLADQCSAGGENPRAVTIRTGETTRTTFNLTCAESPSGRLVYATDRDGNREVYTIRVDGSDRQRITNHSATDGNPAWSPNGSEIVFLSERGGDAGIYRVDADGTDVRLVTDRVAGSTSPTWAPDGSRIAYVTSNGELATIRPDGSDSKVVFESGVDPHWSPDSEKLVFARDGEIWIGNRDGSSASSTGVAAVGQPRWSPDDSRIAFWGDGVQAMDPDGTGVTRLTAGRHPSWSPDSKWIALMDGGDLFVIRRDGADRRQVTNDSFDQGGVSWRP